MTEIRIHGRGGQGSVTAAMLIAESAFCDGCFAQAFPAFGVERRGAPVKAFVRISDKPIRLRSQIYEPDYILIQDITLIGVADILAGAKADTLILINTEKTPDQVMDSFTRSCSIDPKNKFAIPCGLDVIKTVPATQIALDIIGKPIVNTIMLGAFAGLTGLIKKDSVIKAIKNRFSGEIAEKNIKAIEAAFDHSSPHKEFLYLAPPSEKPVYLLHRPGVEA